MAHLNGEVSLDLAASPLNVWKVYHKLQKTVMRIQMSSPFSALSDWFHLCLGSPYATMSLLCAPEGSTGRSRAPLPLRAGCTRPAPPAYWAEADVPAPSEGKQMNCKGWTLMPFGWEITSFISSLYLWDFYVLNDFVHFVVILVLRRERECSCHGKLIDTRRSPSSFFAYSLPCLWGDASPPLWGEGQSWYFVSSQNTKQNERCLAEEGKLNCLPGLPPWGHPGKKVLEQIYPSCVLHWTLPKQFTKKKKKNLLA